MITSKIRRKAPYSSMRSVITAEVEVFNKKAKKRDLQTIHIVGFNSQVDSKGVPLVLPIDQFSGKPFCLNAQGFPMNDIMAFEHAQSNSFAETVLRRINILHPECIDQNLTPDEMFDAIVPSNWSSPAEFVRAQRAFALKWYNRQKAKQPVDPEPSDHNVIKFDDSKTKTE